MMTYQSEAVYDNGVLKLLGSLPLQPLQQVTVTVDITDPAIRPTDRRGQFQQLLNDSAQFRIGAVPTRDEMNER